MMRTGRTMLIAVLVTVGAVAAAVPALAAGANRPEPNRHPGLREWTT